jgi:hypothetical protein
VCISAIITKSFTNTFANLSKGSSLSFEFLNRLPRMSTLDEIKKKQIRKKGKQSFQVHINPRVESKP